MTKLSNRVLQMEESVTLAASARAKALKAQGRDILSLTLGEPDFVTPKNIQDAAITSIENGKASFYTVASGLPELKDAISTYMENFYGYAVKPNEVVVGTGAKFILYAFFATVINPGDEVIIPTPCWVKWLKVFRSLSKRLKLITLKQRLNNLKQPVLKKLKLSCLILHQIQQA